MKIMTVSMKRDGKLLDKNTQSSHYESFLNYLWINDFASRLSTGVDKLALGSVHC